MWLHKIVDKNMLKEKKKRKGKGEKKDGMSFYLLAHLKAR
jgi:hypothetical protein